jgi:hypothetical protein
MSLRSPGVNRFMRQWNWLTRTLTHPLKTTTAQAEVMYPIPSQRKATACYKSEYPHASTKFSWIQANRHSPIVGKLEVGQFKGQPTGF